MRIIVLTIISLLNGLVLLQGQSNLINLSDFLAQEQLEGKEFFLQGSMFDLSQPWIEELEFRTETDEFNLANQEYTLRASVTTPKVRQAQQRVFNDLFTKANYDLQLDRSKEIKAKYLIWINAYFDLEEVTLLNSLTPSYNDLITLHTKQNIDGSVDIPELVKISKDKETNSIEIEWLKSNLIGFLSENSGRKELVDLDFIKGFMEEVVINDIAYIGAEGDVFEMQKIDNQYALEKAEANRVFDFAQFRYKGPHDDGFSDRVSLGFGFKIPYGQKRSFDLLELQLERIIEEEKIKQRKEEFEREIQEGKIELIEAIRIFENYQDLLTRLAKYDQLIETQPAETKKALTSLIELQIDKINQKIDLLKLKEKVFEKFIEYLILINQIRPDLIVD